MHLNQTLYRYILKREEMIKKRHLQEIVYLSSMINSSQVLYAHIFLADKTCSRYFRYGWYLRQMSVLANRLGHNVGQLLRSRQEQRAFDRFRIVVSHSRYESDRCHLSTCRARISRDQFTDRYIPRRCERESFFVDCCMKACVLFQNPPWQTISLSNSGEKEYGGLVFDVIKYLGKKMNFTYSVLSPESNRTIKFTQNKTKTDMVSSCNNISLFHRMLDDGLHYDDGKS